MDSNCLISTFSGIDFSPLAPNPADIRIEDIAHSLAHQCRFAGHVRRFYSVAEHCVHVSHLCPRRAALYGLLHDSSEAYLVDLPRPVKNCVTEYAPYEEVERRLQHAILMRFGLPPIQPLTVTAADQEMLMIEWRDLMAGENTPVLSAELPVITSICVADPWSPEVSEARFLLRFEQLGGKR